MNTQKVIAVYTRSVCQNCTTVKNYLKSKGQRFTEISLDDEANKAAFLAVFPGVKSVPQVTVDGERVENLHQLGNYL